MPVPPNLTPETATAISTLPYDLTLDVSEAPAPMHEVWFTYTGTADPLTVGWWAQADPASVYRPETAVFSPDATTAYRNIVGSGPLQLWVTAGQGYLFRVRHTGAATPLDAPLELSVVPGPNLATPAGALAINDDTEGFPLALLSPTDGTVLQFRQPFPSGETGHCLPSGISLWPDKDAELIRLYDPTLTAFATLPGTFAGFPPITSNRVDRFYVADIRGVEVGGGFFQPTIRTVSSAGVLGPTTWTLPKAVTVIGVSRAEDLLYWTGNGATSTPVAAPFAVFRWDLTTDNALTDLAAAVAGYRVCGELLVLADDTILVGYTAITPPVTAFARRYAPDGTILHTYPFTDITLDRLCAALDDPTSFWAWSWLQGDDYGVSRFEQIRVSDGVVLATMTAPQFFRGAYAATPTPTLRFGHSPSCPLVVLPVALASFTPTDGGGGGGGGTTPPFVAPSYHLDARYIRRLRRAPHANQENQRVFYRRFELDLERGQGLASGQGSDPIVLLRLSRDGGQTWGEEVRLHAGALGAYTQRVLARRLGHARDTVFEVTVSDPIAWSLVGAWLDLEPGTS